MKPPPESPPPDSAPSSWHLAINVPLGQLCSIVLPVLVCLYFGLDTWLVVIATLGWWLLNFRVVDRYLPVLTSPVIETTYRMWQRLRGRAR